MSVHDMTVLLMWLLAVSSAQASIGDSSNGTNGTCLLQKRGITQQTSFADNEDIEAEDEFQGIAAEEEVDAPTCEMQDAIYKKLASMPIHLGTALRFLFHDAVDANNLLYKGDTGKWVPVEDKAGSYGGIDHCLYSPLENGRPKPGHNRNIGIPFYGEHICKLLCSTGSKGLCAKGTQSCAVDVNVMGLNVGLKREGVTGLEMAWGRKKGNCGKPIVTPDTKDKKQILNYASKPAIGFAPSMTGMDNPLQFHEVFAKLGFNDKEHAALMGAHSFGMVRPCADGLNGVEHGPFCSDPLKLTPPLTVDNFAYGTFSKMPGKPKGTCKPKPWIVSKCWSSNDALLPLYAYSASGKVDTWKNKAIKQLKAEGYTGKDLRGTGYAGKAWKNISWTGSVKKGFGDGGFWDRTPMKFDNDYYKLFVGETIDGKDVCCGTLKGNECSRNGKMSVKGKTKKNGLRATTTPCAVNWCRSDRKGRQHMKSTKAWHEPVHRILKKGHHHGTTLRMVRLPGDWALLAKKETKDAVELFAQNESSFHEAFAEAWNKVTRMGYDSLKTCVDKPATSFEKRMIAALGISAGKGMRDDDATPSTGKGKQDKKAFTKGLKDKNKKAKKAKKAAKKAKKAKKGKKR